MCSANRVCVKRAVNALCVKRAFIVGRRCVHIGVVPLTLCPIGSVLNADLPQAESVSIKGVVPLSNRV